MHTSVRLAFGSLLVGAVVLGLKYLAYVVTGSVALYSDALESLVNVATAVAALLAGELDSGELALAQAFFSCPILVSVPSIRRRIFGRCL